MAITQTTQISLSDEALHTAVWGSGASSYEWYESFDFSEDSLTITLVMETDDGGSERATLSVDALRRAIVSIHEEMSSCVVCSVEWTDPECDSEVDADIADCIMQWCVLGDIVWG